MRSHTVLLPSSLARMAPMPQSRLSETTFSLLSLLNGSITAVFRTSPKGLVNKATVRSLACAVEEIRNVAQTASAAVSPAVACNFFIVVSHLPEGVEPVFSVRSAILRLLHAVFAVRQNVQNVYNLTAFTLCQECSGDLLDDRCP